ncbi:MAG: DUF4229 domain-containing protein [Phycicoccus sp.]|mgnify:CR=1 FL=1|nr:DUF4229 domain-containing protein [Phycicoccus sp.]
MLRYTVLRFLIFFGCLLVLWLIGLRSRDDLGLLILGSALLSMVISYFALRPFRQAYSQEIAEKLQSRAEARDAKRGDEAAEDAEDAETGDEGFR